MFDRFDIGHLGQENSVMYYNSSGDKIIISYVNKVDQKHNTCIKYFYMFIPKEISVGPAICSFIHHSFIESGSASTLQGRR